mmetsp:Transcript_3212/g.5306  ORF Transcript_3212/g.5306 Transcript_3212/m.5306 type:complete len:253 (-) Transcript_3212:45-803(-)
MLKRVVARRPRSAVALVAASKAARRCSSASFSNCRIRFSSSAAAAAAASAATWRAFLANPCCSTFSCCADSSACSKAPTLSRSRVSSSSANWVRRSEFERALSARSLAASAAFMSRMARMPASLVAADNRCSHSRVADVIRSCASLRAAASFSSDSIFIFWIRISKSFLTWSTARFKLSSFSSAMTVGNGWEIRLDDEMVDLDPPSPPLDFLGDDNDNGGCDGSNGGCDGGNGGCDGRAISLSLPPSLPWPR